MFGYEPDSLAGENICDYLHPDGREHATETFDTVSNVLRAPQRSVGSGHDGGWFKRRAMPTCSTTTPSMAFSSISAT
ncbi:hypothetical protein C8039_19400 [Halogeometricum sp. wsp3]|nr:hypothetical protein C8039_19400 [Halogeometricum sp. wsp3]